MKKTNHFTLQIFAMHLAESQEADISLIYMKIQAIFINIPPIKSPVFYFLKI